MILQHVVNCKYYYDFKLVKSLNRNTVKTLLNYAVYIDKYTR